MAGRFLSSLETQLARGSPMTLSPGVTAPGSVTSHPLPEPSFLQGDGSDTGTGRGGQSGSLSWPRLGLPLPPPSAEAAVKTQDPSLTSCGLTEKARGGGAAGAAGGVGRWTAVPAHP